MRRSGELVPHEFMERLVAGEAPLRLWREQRGISQAALAKAANVRQPTIRSIERGAGASIATMRRLAKALGVEIEEILPLDE